MTHTTTIFAVVDARGEFKKSGRFDTGEFDNQRQADEDFAEQEACERAAEQEAEQWQADGEAAAHLNGAWG